MSSSETPTPCVSTPVKQSKHKIGEDERLIGLRIKQARLELGFTRQDIAAQIGVTHQQLEKYEKGANRISIRNLYILCQALDKPLEWFIDDLEGTSISLTSETMVQTRFVRKVMGELRKVKRKKDQQKLLKLLRYIVDEELW